MDGRQPCRYVLPAVELGMILLILFGQMVGTMGARFVLFKLPEEVVVRMRGQSSVRVAGTHQPKLKRIDA